MQYVLERDIGVLGVRAVHIGTDRVAFAAQCLLQGLLRIRRLVAEHRPVDLLHRTRRRLRGMVLHSVRPTGTRHDAC